MPVNFQQQGQAVGRVPVIVDHQHFEPMAEQFRLRFCLRGVLGFDRQLQRHREGTALPQACAVRLDAALMHPDQSLGQVQPQAQSVECRVLLQTELTESVEHPLEVLWCDAHAGIPDTEANPGSIHFSRHGNEAIGRGELARIVHEVRHHLPDSSRVGMHQGLSIWQFEADRYPGFLRNQARCIDDVSQQLEQIEGPAPQWDGVGLDARDIEQIINQAGHVIDLPLDHFQSIPANQQFGIAQQQCNQIAGGCKRAAQLMSQHRDELVLATVGFLQSRLSPPSLGDLENDACHPDWHTVRVAKHVERDVEVSGNPLSRRAQLAANRKAGLQHLRCQQVDLGCLDRVLENLEGAAPDHIGLCQSKRGIVNPGIATVQIQSKKRDRTARDDLFEAPRDGLHRPRIRIRPQSRQAPRPVPQSQQRSAGAAAVRPALRAM